jgi:hypothetical protein
MAKKTMSKTRKYNKKNQYDNTSINHDSIVSDEGDTDVGGDADGEDDFDNNLLKKRLHKIKAKNWTMHTNSQLGRLIHPIPFTEPT